MKLKHLLWLFAIVAALVGCGGGGAGGTAPAGSGAVFMTDSIDNNVHVWVTVKQVVFTSATGNVTAYSDPAGTTVDLRSLHDGAGKRFAFLTSIPAGTYTGVNVTVDKTVTIFPLGSPTGVTRVIAGNNGSTATLSLVFGTPKVLGPGINFALDFDLSHWNDDGVTLTGAPFLDDASDDSGISDHNRHEHEGYEGTIQGLTGTAPDQTFTLNHDGHTVAVVTNAQTVIFNSNGAASPSLASGERVEVRGAFDTAQNAIVADSVKIRIGGDGHDSPRVEGSASSIDTNAFAFVVSADEVRGFQPSATTVNVATTGTTVFNSHHGATLTQAEFFALLASGNRVEVEGTYDANSNTMTASKIHLEDGNGGGGEDHHSMAQGPASNIDANAFTFDITAHEWEGMNISNGTVVHVTTSLTTVFNQGAATRAQFFAALTNGSGVEAEGAFDSSTNTLTADTVKTHH